MSRWVCLSRVKGGIARGMGFVDVPSRSSQKPIFVWPRPMVYFPVATPSNFSSSACSTHYFCRRISVLDVYALQADYQTHLVRDIEFNCLDANIRGSRHDGSCSTLCQQASLQSQRNVPINSRSSNLLARALQYCPFVAQNVGHHPPGVANRWPSPCGKQSLRQTRRGRCECEAHSKIQRTQKSWLGDPATMCLPGVLKTDRGVVDWSIGFPMWKEREAFADLTCRDGWHRSPISTMTCSVNRAARNSCYQRWR